MADRQTARAPDEAGRPPTGGGAAGLAALTLMLFLAALLGARAWSAAIPEAGALFRPELGVLLGALLSFPSRRPAIMAAAFAALAAAHWAGEPGLRAAGFAAADAAGVLSAEFLIRRMPWGSGFLNQLSGSVRFFALAVPAAAAMQAVLTAATTHVFPGQAGEPPLLFVALGMASGLAVAAPALIAWSRPEYAWENNRARHARFVGVFAAALALSYLAGARPAWLAGTSYRPLPYAAFPFLLWAALDFGVRGAATVNLGLYLLGAWLDIRGEGPFHLGRQLGGSLGEGPIGPLLWFPYSVAFCSLAPAALVRRHRRVEADLRMSEARYGNLWNSKMVGLYVEDPAGKIRDANGAFLAMMGLERSDLAGDGIDILEMSTEEYRKSADARIQVFKADGRIGPFEREWVLRDGRRLLSMVYAARMDDSGLALGMVMDVRELDQARKELRLRESRYRGLLSSTFLGVFVSTVEGRILEANDTFLGMIRRTREDLEAGRLHSREFAPPEYMTGAAERRRLFDEEGRMGPFERDWVLADGTRRSTLFFATRIGKGDALCIVFDVQELKRTKMELRSVESRFKKLLDANLMGVAVFDRNLAAEEANDAFLSITGYDREDLAAGRLTMPGLSGGASRGGSWGLDEASRPPREAGWIRKDGAAVPVFAGLTRLDESERWLAVALDLSELKRAQGELRAAKTAAEAASLAKSDFLAHMSHEIRTPLNGLLGMLFLLLDTRLDPEQARYANAAREAGGHLLALINRILDFSKIERGELEIAHQPFALADAIEGAVSLLREDARRKGIVLSTGMDERLSARIVGDSLRLKQVVLNLAGNAVKFSTGGEIGIRARLLERDGTRCRIEIEVSDQGPGIAPEAMAGLFQPFRQGTGSPTPGPAGTGLGLAISRDLVRRMGGEIEVESEVGRGSRFRFHFRAGIPEGTQRSGIPPADSVPLPDSETATGGKAQSTPPPAMPAWPAGKRKPVALVVEDHPVSLTIARAMLEKSGCAVDTAPDGPAALAAAAARNYDILFMDCQLPGMDGFETTRRLRRAEAGGRRVPIVALTAHAIAGMRERCLAEGMDDYLSKPFAPEEIGAILRKWLGDGEGRTGDARPGAAIPGPGPSVPLVNAGRLKAFDDGSEEGRRATFRLVDLFLSTSRESLDRIGAECRSGSAEALAKSLHRMKGGCATVGADALAARLKELELVLRSSGPGRVERELPALEELFADTGRRFRELFAESSGTVPDPAADPLSRSAAEPPPAA